MTILRREGGVLSTSAERSTGTLDDVATQLLRWVFRDQAARALVTSFPEDPLTAPPAAWLTRSAGNCWRTKEWPLPAEHNQYFCVSLFKGSDGRRQHVNFEALYALAIDDVGTKVKAESLQALLGEPGWIIETSPNNEQWIYRFRAPVTAIEKANRLVGLIKNDAKLLSRVMRLPGGLNTKKAYGGAFVIRVQRKPPSDSAIGELDAETLLATFGVVAADKIFNGLLTTEPAKTVNECIDRDVVGGWLLELGLVKRLTSSGLALDITCPWVHEHSHGLDDGAAYWPKTGGFRCHHGHCAERNWQSLREWLELTLADRGIEGGIFGRRFESVPSDPTDKLYREVLIEQNIFVKNQGKYLDLKSGELIAEKPFNDVQQQDMLPWLAYEDDKGKTKLMSCHQWFLRNGGRVATRMANWPGQDVFFKDDYGVATANLWRPGLRPARGQYVSEADIAPWLNLVRAVCADERFVGIAGIRSVADVLLDWFALVVASPNIKPGWHVILHSLLQGIGKDTILKPVLRAVGDSNMASPSFHTLAGQFNKYAEKRLVSVADLRRNTRGSATGHDLYHMLTPLAENTTRILEVNQKGVSPYFVLNVACFTVTTNQEDALQIPEIDRRWCVIASQRVPQGTPGEARYYADLNAWLDKNWPLIAEFLYARFMLMLPGQYDFLMGRAPMTLGKQSMILAAEDKLTSWTREQIVDGIWPDLMSSDEVEQAYTNAVRRRVLDHVPPSQRWGPILRNKFGAEQWKNSGELSAIGSQIRLPGGRKIRIWILRNWKNYRDKNLEEIKTAYEQQNVVSVSAPF